MSYGAVAVAIQAALEAMPDAPWLAMYSDGCAVPEPTTEEAYGQAVVKHPETGAYLRLTPLEEDAAESPPE